MNPKTLYTISGVISVIVGVLAGLCLFDIKLTFLALLFAVIGFLMSGVNIFLNEKYDFSGGKYSIGFIGMIFSSIPVLFILYIIFRHK
ncbi:MAG: hypothetical protein ACXVPQ_10035 [Bacteroidia bacterium]